MTKTKNYKLTKIMMLSLLASILFFYSCKKDEDTPTPINESEVLINYLESAESPASDFVNTYLPSITTATDVYTLNQTNQVYIIDIRSADDFAAGHIANAHNVALSDIITHVEGVDLSGYEKIAVVCYTGQTASYATSLLRLTGYNNAFSMKWGMCSWDSTFIGPWQSNRTNTYATQFTSDATAKGNVGDLPTLSTGKETGADILEARVNYLLTNENEGFGGAAISNSVVFDNLSNYYIINYWPEADYTGIGHIPGATQYTPKESIKLAADLKTIPTDKTVVVYCYTGQTSAFLTAYLRLIGYDAKSLKFGTNGMIYDEMTAHKFTPDAVMGYTYVTGTK